MIYFIDLNVNKVMGGHDLHGEILTTWEIQVIIFRHIMIRSWALIIPFFKAKAMEGMNPYLKYQHFGGYRFMGVIFKHFSCAEFDLKTKYCYFFSFVDLKFMEVMKGHNLHGELLATWEI